MQYDHILIRYGELALKGNNIKVFINQLQRNIRHKLKNFPNIQLKKTQGRLFILLNGENPEPILEICKSIFGISSLSLAIKVKNDVDEIKNAALYALKNAEGVKTFKVSVRRVDKTFPYGSQEMNHIVGGHLLKSAENITVNVHQPDVEVKVEIRNHNTFITSAVIKGLGGFPVGTSGKSLLLLSGGIDSPVAGYLAIKRGVAIEAIHFHSPPYTSERAKQKVLDLAKKLTKFSKEIKIHVVPFTKLQQEIFKSIPDGYAMTVMRRMMLRISERVCQKNDILSLTTGESLGQVASQTMESMNAINEVTNYPVLRPLISMDKHEIIKISQEIDTYEISIRPYEDCCTIFVPKSPKTKPKRDRINHFEEKFNYQDLLEETIAGIDIITVKDEEEVHPTFDNLL